MESTLAEFGATLALGAFLLLGIALIIELWWPDVILSYLTSDHIPKFYVASFAAAIALSAGLLVENISNRVVDSPAAIILSPIPNEQGLRASVLLTNPLWTQYHRNPDALKLLTAAHVDPKTIDLLRQNAPPDNPRKRNIDEIYYTAKNTVFLRDNYYDELKARQSRIDFARSFTMTCMITMGIAILSFLAIIRPAGSLTRMQITKRLLWSLVFFFLLYCVGRFAYTAEEREFNKRVFGYFLIVAVMPNDA